MSDFGFYPSLGALTPARTDVVGAFERGYLAPAQMEQANLQNQLSKMKMAEEQRKLNAMQEFAQTKDPSALMGVNPQLYANLKEYERREVKDAIDWFDESKFMVMNNPEAYEGWRQEAITKHKLSPSLFPEKYPGRDWFVQKEKMVAALKGQMTQYQAGQLSIKERRLAQQGEELEAKINHLGVQDVAAMIRAKASAVRAARDPSQLNNKQVINTETGNLEYRSVEEINSNPGKYTSTQVDLRQDTAVKEAITQAEKSASTNTEYAKLDARPKKEFRGKADPYNPEHWEGGRTPNESDRLKRKFIEEDAIRRIQRRTMLSSPGGPAARRSGAGGAKGGATLQQHYEEAKGKISKNPMLSPEEKQKRLAELDADFARRQGGAAAPMAPTDDDNVED